MADTQEAPQLPESAPGEPGSISQAQNALLGLLNSEEEPPKNQKSNLPKKRLQKNLKMSHWRKQKRN